MNGPRALTMRPFWFALLVIVIARATAGVAAVSVRILAPDHSALVPDQLVVVAQIASQFEVSSATARLSDRSVNLLFNTCAIVVSGSCQAGWRWTLQLASVPRGNYELTVTATETGGATGAETRIVRIDRMPTVTVQQPTDSAVARPVLRVTARCSEVRR